MDDKKSENFAKALLKSLSVKGPFSAVPFASLPPSSANERLPGEAGAATAGRSRAKAFRFNPYGREARRRVGGAVVAPPTAPATLPDAHRQATRPPYGALPCAAAAGRLSPSTLAAAPGPPLDGFAAGPVAPLPKASAQSVSAAADVDSLGLRPEVELATPVAFAATSSSEARERASGSAVRRAAASDGDATAIATSPSPASASEAGCCTMLSAAAAERGFVGGSGYCSSSVTSRTGSHRRIGAAAGSALVKWLKSSFRGNKAEAACLRAPLRDIQNLPAAAAAEVVGECTGSTDVKVPLTSESQQCDGSPLLLSTFPQCNVAAVATDGRYRNSTCSDDLCSSSVSDSIVTSCASLAQPPSGVDVTVVCSPCEEPRVQHQPEHALLLPGNVLLHSGNDASEATTCHQPHDRAAGSSDCISSCSCTSGRSGSGAVGDDLQVQGFGSSADGIVHPWHQFSVEAAQPHTSSLQSSTEAAVAVEFPSKSLVDVDQFVADPIAADQELIVEPVASEKRLTESLAGSAPASAAASSSGRFFTSIIQEFMKAERTYVRHLYDVIAGYKDRCEQHQDLFSKSEVTLLFGNITDVYHFSNQLLASLETCARKAPGLGASADKPASTCEAVISGHGVTVQRSEPAILPCDWTCSADQAATDLAATDESSGQLCCDIARCFLDRREGFLVYSDYCNNHDRAAYLYSSLVCEVRYQRFFEDCRLLRGMDKIPLNGYLLTPVQKICKYHLQLAELVSSSSECCSSGRDTAVPRATGRCPALTSALAVMRDVVHRVNEQKRISESCRSVDEWQVKVANWQGDSISRCSTRLILSGEHVREEWVPTEKGSFYKRASRQRRSYYLFDAELIECQKFATASKRSGQQLSLCRRYRLAPSAAVVAEAVEEEVPPVRANQGEHAHWELLDANDANAATPSSGHGGEASIKHGGGLLPIRSQRLPRHALLLRPAVQLVTMASCGRAPLTILCMKTAADKAAWLEAVRSSCMHSLAAARQGSTD